MIHGASRTRTVSIGLSALAAAVSVLVMAAFVAQYQDQTRVWSAG